MLWLTVERQRRGLSKAALARKAKLDQGLISKIESGRVRPYPAELRRLVKAVDWPREEAQRLLKEVDE